MFAAMQPAPEVYDLTVVGGGAAGFFGAIQTAELQPGLRILILEKSNKLLAKVKVSGGGRCNVTHECFNPVVLSHHYPRGEKRLKNQFKTFGAAEVMAWFAAKGVKLKAEEDGRMFPVTDNSQTIIDCFMQAALQQQIKIEIGEGVQRLAEHEGKLQLITSTGKKFLTRHVLIATGGNPNAHAYEWLTNTGTVVPPIPSLFTFNDLEKKFNDLMGVSVPAGEVRIATTKFRQEGPVLITHWGLSGPAVIRLSAWAAEYLHGKKYEFTALVSWIGPAKEEDIRAELLEQKSSRGRQKIFTNPLYQLPQRLWVKLCALSEIEENKIWAELPQKNLNRLMEFLIRCPFHIKGKTTFKEEFVTCGGIDLKDVNPETMESKKMKGVFFAGEVLNIDGETGGFNFQAAWTTAFIAAKAIASSMSK
jgi:predicted Rossmann fold flavoprotein